MKSATFWIILLTAVLILEGALILINNPELNLIGGIILLGILLFALGRRFSSGDFSGKRRKDARHVKDAGTRTRETGSDTPAGSRDHMVRTPSETAVPVKGTPASRERFPTFSAWGRKVRTLIPARRRGAVKPGAGSPGTPAPKEAGSSPPVIAREKPEKKRKFWRREKTLPDAGTTGPAREPVAGTPVSPAKKKRFETFTAMGTGLRLLVSSFSRGKKKTEATAPPMGMHMPEDSESPSSLASLKADAASPVSVKRDPSPFSPLVQDMDLDSDLIHARPEPGKGGSPDLLYSDADMDAMETATFDQDMAKLDLSLDEDSTITIDDEEQDEVAQILDAYQDELVTPDSESDELNLDNELAGLENLDLDLPVLEPDDGLVAPPPPRQSAPGLKGVAAPAASSDSSPRAAAQPFSMDPGSKTMSSSSARMQEKTQDESMLSFAAASSGDDDLISSLRSDMKSTKRQVDQSLVRDLKDVRVQISDIEKDLSSFEKDLAAFIAKRNK